MDFWDKYKKTGNKKRAQILDHNCKSIFIKVALCTKLFKIYLFLNFGREICMYILW